MITSGLGFAPTLVNGIMGPWRHVFTRHHADVYQDFVFQVSSFIVLYDQDAAMGFWNI